MANLSVDVVNLNTSWNTDAQTYERRHGGSTHSVAKYIASIAPSLNSNSSVLDSCCGTGAFTLEFLNNANFKSAPISAKINAIDNSQAMIKITQSLVDQNGWQDIVKAEKMDATKLKFPDNTFDLSVISFGIFFFPDPVQGAKEMYRTLKPGGIAYVTCWKETIYIPIFYEVQKIVQPTKYVALRMFETWRKKETIEETLKRGLFSNIELLSLDVMTVQKDMDEVIDILATRFHDFVGNEWTEEEKMQLPLATRKVMIEQRETFSVGLDEFGKVGLPMCAWIARGTK